MSKNWEDYPSFGEYLPIARKEQLAARKSGRGRCFIFSRLAIRLTVVGVCSMNTIKILAPSLICLTESILIEGDVRDALARLPSESVQCVVTSPPYWGLRDYGIPGQIGLESSLPGYIQSLTGVFREVRRVLKSSGLLWLNIGDGYTSGNRGWRAPDKKNPNRAMSVRPNNPPGLKDKDLIGVPWRLAFALQEDGWYLRTDVVWNKPNAMPESVKDRPTRAHEYLFMFAKSESYQYFPDAIAETGESSQKRNKRSVWNVNTAPNPAHIAAFPLELVSPCIEASTVSSEFVLDPFAGSGTVGVACQHLNRRFVGIELNPEYIKTAHQWLEGKYSSPRKLVNLGRSNGAQGVLLETHGKRRR
jgi:site-specific DNA-methyltransferase (cytosine-N4-specific)